MSKYELTIISAGDQDSAHAESVVADTEKSLLAAKATVDKKHQWGRRALAYPIGRQTHGYYTTFEFTADGPAIAVIERDIRMHGLTIRFLTTEGFEKPVSLAAPAPVATTEVATATTAEEELRRTSSAAPTKKTVKKAPKIEEAEDESTRQLQVEEALSKILEDAPTETTAVDTAEATPTAADKPAKKAAPKKAAAKKTTKKK